MTTRLEPVLLHGGNRDWAAQQANCLPQEILDFSASINPLGTPASVLTAIQQAIPLLSSYPDRQYLKLRQAIADFHQIDPAWVMPGNGAAELLTWAGRDLAKMQAVGLVVPAFSDYARALNGFQANIFKLNLDLANLPPTPSKNLGLLLNNPHNPTGKLFNRDRLLPLLNQFGLVVVDEAFMDFLHPLESQSLIGSVANYPNLVILRSLTKFYALPGLRIGYAIAHPDRLKKWQSWRDPWSVNVLAEAAAIACLTDLEFQQQTWHWLTEARSHLFAGLAKIPGLTPQPSAANFLLVESEISGIELRDYLLLNHRILIRDCLSFEELGDRYFRVCVGTLATQAKLLNALTEATEKCNRD
jgi:L-threonine-O-3-phosphate decarboxylase